MKVTLTIVVWPLRVELVCQSINQYLFPISVVVYKTN